MTQEDIDLLLKDICARLPYNVKVLYENKVFSVDYISAIYEEIKLDIPDNYTLGISEIKPYLFPLSSMTEEQLFEVSQIIGIGWEINTSFISLITSEAIFKRLSFLELDALFQWLNANHFDFRNLIGRGLAIDCTDLNIY